MTARTLARLGIAALAIAAIAAGANAAQPRDRSCSGQLSGNLISPLPKGVVLRVHITDASAANLALGERFKAGLAAAGAMLSDDGGVTMEFATSITGLPDAAATTGAVSPEFGMVGMVPPTKDPPVLTMSISLMDTKLAQIDWVGYVNCKIHGTDLGQVAQDLGYSIGRSIGQTFPPRPL